MADETQEQATETGQVGMVEVPDVIADGDLPDWLQQTDVDTPGALMLPRAASVLVGGVQRLLELDALEERRREAEQAKERAEAYEVDSADAAEAAAEHVRELREREKQNKAAVSALIDPIRKRGLDPLYELRRELTNPLSDAQSALKRKMKAWQRKKEEERRRREEERRRKAQEEARKRREQAAMEAAEEDDEERFEAIARNLDAPAKPEPTDDEEPAEDEEPAQPTGTHTVDNWKMRLVGQTVEEKKESLRKLAAAVAEGNAPATLLELNEKKARELAKATAGEIAFPGLECWNDKTVVVR